MSQASTKTGTQHDINRSTSTPERRVTTSQGSNNNGIDNDDLNDGRDENLIPWSIVLTSVATVAFAGLATLWIRHRRRWHHKTSERRENPTESTSRDSLSAYESLIGDTPLVELRQLSQLIGRRILVKMESLNPGGTGKDRAALSMIRRAEALGKLPPPPIQTRPFDDCIGNSSSVETKTSDEATNKSSNPNEDNSEAAPKQQQQQQDSFLLLDPILEQAATQSRTGGVVVEGTSGSTGISLASLSRGRGHACVVVMPDDQAQEKVSLLKALGAVVHVVPTASIANPHHYVNIARRLAERANSSEQHANMQAVFIDQFENDANFEIHYQTTGPEIWQACTNGAKKNSGRLDAFCMSAGTGGTISGVAKYIKEQSATAPNNQNAPRIVLVDPPGSSLYHKIQHGVAFAPQQAEQRLKRHRYDTLAEGIGLDRVTNNLALGLPYIDQAMQISDQEAVDMAHWLLKHEGLFVGSSSAMNVVGAVRTALDLPNGAVVVTIICDGGQRHVTRFWNREFVVSNRGLEWPGDSVGRIPECLRQHYV